MSGRQCLGCGSTRTTENGRVLKCAACEVVHFIPAAQLVTPATAKRAYERIAPK